MTMRSGTTTSVYIQERIPGNNFKLTENYNSFRSDNGPYLAYFPKK